MGARAGYSICFGPPTSAAPYGMSGCSATDAIRQCAFRGEFEGAKALTRREGDRLVVAPVRKGRLLDLLARLQPLPEKFPDVDDTLAPLDDVEI